MSRGLSLGQRLLGRLWLTLGRPPSDGALSPHPEARSTRELKVVLQDQSPTLTPAAASVLLELLGQAQAMFVEATLEDGPERRVVLGDQDPHNRILYTFSMKTR